MQADKQYYLAVVNQVSAGAALHASALHASAARTPDGLLLSSLLETIARQQQTCCRHSCLSM